MKLPFTRRLFMIFLILTFVAFPGTQNPVHAQGMGATTGFKLWRAVTGGFNAWQLAGVLVAEDGTLRLDPASAQAGTDPFPAGSYNGRNYYNGGNYFIGEATSPVSASAAGFQEAVASWNATTPAGIWVEILLRAQVEGRWTKWYNMGIWASGSSTIERHSVDGQADADGDVQVDTLVLSSGLEAEHFQVKVRLFGISKEITPVVRLVAVTTSDRPPRQAGNPEPGNPSLWGRILDIPQCSQMVYPDGGKTWCSPTSTSMVLGFWGVEAGGCEKQVRNAVSGVYDGRFNAYGNWSFNTAYAATHGMEAYVRRFDSLAQLEPWIQANTPVVLAVAWNNNLTCASLPSSLGHLLVLVGFDPQGNPVVNDPAAPDDSTVRRTCLRAELEQRWLEASAGTAYVIRPISLEWAHSCFPWHKLCPLLR